MSRELNTPREMGLRLAYVAQLLMFLGGAVLGLAGGFGSRLDQVAAAVVLIAGAWYLRYIGFRRLEFARLEKCFPTGASTEESYVEECIDELHVLFERLENHDMAPRERQKLRQQIVEMLRSDERLSDYYRARLTKRHPYLLNAL